MPDFFFRLNDMVSPAGSDKIAPYLEPKNSWQNKGDGCEGYGANEPHEVREEGQHHC